MNELYYGPSASPSKRVNKLFTGKSTFNLKVRRNYSTDLRSENKENLSDGYSSNPYGSCTDYVKTYNPYNEKQTRATMNKSSALPKIDTFQGKIMTVDQFNKMVTTEMTMIRDLKRRKKRKESKSVHKIFKLSDSALGSVKSADTYTAK